MRPTEERQQVTAVPPAPSRAAHTHKGQAGRVAIVAGTRGMSGAAILCAQGALRGGAGLVRAFCDAETQPTLAAAEPCLMTSIRPEPALPQWHCDVYDPFRAALNWADVLAIGPGLGESSQTLTLVGAVLSRWSKPVILDADALNVLANENVGPEAWWEETFKLHGPAVITPHPGEMARLLRAIGDEHGVGDDDDARITAAANYAGRAKHLVVVLKGHRTVVTDGQRVYVNQSGNAGMATGGMGDVLTGLIAALAAQGLPPFEAACRATWQHGAAADLLAREIGPVGYLATDVARALPRVREH